MESWYFRRKRRQLLLLEFLHADAHVMRQHEAEEDLLLGVEVGADDQPGARRPFFAGLGRRRTRSRGTIRIFSKSGIVSPALSTSMSW